MASSPATSDSSNLPSLSLPISSPLLPSPTPRHSPIAQHPCFPFMRLFCTLAVLLRTAAAAKDTLPSSAGFQGLCLIPWLAARIRLRQESLHRIAVSRLINWSHRDPPIPALACGLDPSGSLNSGRRVVWPLWIFDWPEPGPAPRSTIRSSPKDPGEVLPFRQSQPESIGFYHQAGNPSSSKLSSRPVEPSRPMEPSRPVEPSRMLEPIQSSGPSRMTHLLSDFVGLLELLFRPRSDMAQFLEPFTYT